MTEPPLDAPAAADAALFAEAAALLGFPGEPVFRVDFAAQTVAALAVIDEGEAARRAAAGLPPVVCRRLLDALAELPYGHRVGWDGLDPVTAAVLTVAPAGVVDADDRGVMRLWRPAVRVGGVLAVGGGDWEPALTAASWFFPDAARAALLTEPPSRPAELIFEAAWFGVGAVAREPGGLRRLAHAEAPLVRCGPRHWRFLETVYAAWAQGASRRVMSG